jgi:acetyltransferase-like isoleucine patch superfamily enzyme
LTGTAIRLANFCRVTFWRLVLRLRGGRLGRRCTIHPGVCLACARDRPIVIGDGVRLMRGVVLSTAESGRIELGDNVYIGEYGVITSNAAVHIGADTIIAPHANVVDFNHTFHDLDTPVVQQPADADPIRIGRDVWLGAGVTVLKGITIGDRVVVGAGALVRHDLPDRAVAVGSPARVIRYRGKAEPVAPEEADS